MSNEAELNQSPLGFLYFYEDRRCAVRDVMMNKSALVDGRTATLRR